MARDPILWEDPLKFDPERFSSDKQQSHPYIYVPFSAGPRYLNLLCSVFTFLSKFHFLFFRNCIGQKFAMLEMKITIAKALKHFEMSVVPGFNPIIISELILRPENGIWLQLKERKAV